MTPKRLVLVASAAFGAAALPACPAFAACPAGTVQVGEERVRESEYVIRVSPVCEPIEDNAVVNQNVRLLPPCDSLPPTFEAMLTEVRGLRRELQRNVHEAARISSALDDWVGLQQEARRQAHENALDQATDLALEKLLEKLSTKARMHRELTVQQAALLRREWGAIVSRLSGMSPSEKAFHMSRIANATTAEQGVRALEIGLDAVDATYEVGEAAVERTRVKRLEAMASVLELVETISYANPFTSLLIHDLKSFDNAVYGWWAALAARNQLGSFIALEDGVLSEAIRESNRYVVLSNAISASRRGDAYCKPAVS